MIRKVITILCVLALLITAAQPVTASAFDSKAAKKKVTVTYKKLPDGILVFYKNKNKSAVQVTSTMCFMDNDTSVLSKEKQTVYCLAAKSTAAIFFKTPLNEYAQPVNYSTYKGSFSVSKSKYKSRNKNITISSELDAAEARFAAVNTGKVDLTNVYITVVFYDDSDSILGCSTKFLNCYSPNAIDQFSINLAGRGYVPTKAKIYLNGVY